MNETRLTLGLAGAAVVLAVLVFVTEPSPPKAAAFSDLNTPFHPEFKDPLKVAALEVVDYSESLNAQMRFKVEIKDGVGRIPSHHNYPADAKDRLVNAATSLIDLRREKFHSDSATQHVDFGVVDPLDAGASGTQGRGQRIILADATGNVLADLILGKPFGEKKDQRYVRLPGQKHTFSIRSKVDISTKFEDWIETDLLQLEQGKIRKVDLDSYSFDKESGQLKNRAVYGLARDESFGPWKVSQMKETEEAHPDNVSQMMGALDDLKILGVRPKPRALADFLRQHHDIRFDVRLTEGQIDGFNTLRRYGYYFVPKGKDLSFIPNDGEVKVACEDGILYTLRFGEVLVGSGAEVTAGAEEGKEPKKGGTENRYLLITVQFDPALAGAAPAEPKPYAADPNKKPDEQKADEEKAKKDKEEYDRKKTEYEKKLADGKKRAQKLTARFADWHYVISEDSFRKIRRSRADLLRTKEVKKEEHKEGDGHKHDEKKPPEKPAEKKPDAPKPPEEKKPEEKKP